MTLHLKVSGKNPSKGKNKLILTQLKSFMFSKCITDVFKYRRNSGAGALLSHPINTDGVAPC